MTGELPALFSLKGRTCLVTGPTSGIGLACARMFATAGASLVLAGNDEPACDMLANELGGLSVPTDVTDRDALRSLADRAEAWREGVDVLVCNAGIAGRPGSMSEQDEDIRCSLWKTNFDHALALSTFVAPRMASRKRGSIVLMSSIAGLRGNARLGDYAMTKAAIAQLARNLAVEWGPSGVRANAIAPGLIDTSWSGAVLSDAAAAERRLGLTPLRRVGRTDEVAATALYLASDAGGFTTGQTLVVDGGTLVSDGN